MSTGAKPEMFRGTGDFVEPGHFDKHKVKKKPRENGPAEKHLGYFFS